MLKRSVVSPKPVPPAPAPAVVVAQPVITVRTLVVSALLVLAIVTFVMALKLVADTVLLLLVAIVVAEGLRPLVLHAERLHIGKLGSLLLVYVLLIAALALVITVLVSPIVSEARTLSSNSHSYVERAQPVISQVTQSLNLQQKNINLSQDLENSLTSAGGIAISVGGYILGIVVNLVLILLLGFLWLASVDRIKLFTIDLFPPSHQPLAADVLREMGYRMGGYLRATAINMLVVGVATGVACWFLHLPSPVLLGIFAGIAGAIPLVGPFVGAVPAVLLGFTVSPTYPIWVAVVIVAVQLLDANLVVPQVMNRVVALPALAVVLALLVGGAVAGIVGALLAIPLAAAMQVLVLRVLVPWVHHTQGRDDEAYAKAATPLTPALRATAPTGGGRRREAR